jgi:hypothetical protein
MRNSEHNTTTEFVSVHGDDPELVYANDVQIMAEPGGLQLTFLRPRAAVGESGQTAHDNEATTEVIARVVLPPLAARRLLRLLPRRLDLQQALADEYDRVTDAELERDPFRAAHAEAEYDDEPYTDEQKAAARAGRDAFARGEFATLDEVWRELGEENDATAASTS